MDLKVAFPGKWIPASVRADPMLRRALLFLLLLGFVGQCFRVSPALAGPGDRQVAAYGLLGVLLVSMIWQITRVTSMDGFWGYSVPAASFTLLFFASTSLLTGVLRS